MGEPNENRSYFIEWVAFVRKKEKSLERYPGKDIWVEYVNL
jgi:hypothetical protein